MEHYRASRLNIFESCIKNDIFEESYKYIKKNKRIKSKSHFNIRLFLLVIILYVNIQDIISYDSSITLKIYGFGNQQIIDPVFKKHISSISINDIEQPAVNNIYNFTELNNTVKITFSNSFNDLTSFFSNCKNIYEIDFKNFDKSDIKGVRFIFKNCKSLKSLDLSDWNVEKVENLQESFLGCTSLTSLKLPNFENSKLTVLSSTFKECENLSSLDLSTFKTNQVQYMDYTFYGCKSLISLDLSNFDTSSLKNSQNMFKECRALQKLDLSNFKTPKLESMGSMFTDCESLTSLDITNFDTSKVDSMYELFKNCKLLTSLNILNFDTSSVRNMDGMFCSCNLLTSIDLSNFNTSLVSSMSQMFFNCKSLTSLNLSTFDTSKVQYMSSMLRSCDLLTSLNLSNFNMDSIREIRWMFMDSKNLRYVNLSNSNPNTSILIHSYDLFKGTPANLVICSESEKISKEFLIPSTCHIINCNDNWRDSQKKIIQNDNSKCYIDCNETPNKYDYYSICVQTCPPSTYVIGSNCINCHPDCKTCKGPFSDTNSNCISCISPNKYLENGNCISNDTNLYSTNKIDIAKTEEKTFDTSSELAIDTEKNLQTDILTDKSTDIINNKIIDTENTEDIENIFTDKQKDLLNNRYTDRSTDIIRSTLKDKTTDILIDEILDYTTKKTKSRFTDLEDNIATELSKDFTTYITKNTENIKINLKDNYINIVSLYNTTNNSMIYNIIKENLLPSFDPENDFEIISEAVDDVVFQITTAKNQLKALNNISLNNYNLSILDISNCETVLKDKYNLNEDDNLILLKKEKQSNKASEKEVQLEIYEPYNKTKLNLSFCQETKINIYAKAELSKETKYSLEQLKSLGYDMFNINDPFYQDICIEYTSYGNTDIALSDRINYIYNNDDTKCQPNCKTSKYLEESEYINCSCTINEEVNNMNEKFSSKKVFESFLDVLKYSNYKVLKCYNLVFTEFLSAKNIGGIIVFIFILINLGCLVIFIIKGINPLKNKLELKIGNNNNNDLGNIENKDIIVNNKIDIYKNKIDKDNDNKLNALNP